MITFVVEMDDTDLFGWADPEIRQKNLRLALNSTGRWTRTRMDREIRKQINYPASYLRPSTGRLAVTDFATAQDLRVRITGRVRETSLARFAAKGSFVAGGNYKKKLRTKAQKERAGATRVTVKPGRQKIIKGAFLVKLRGSSDGGNIGMAIRTSGGKPKGAYAPTPLKAFGPNVYLLYGPSVNQALWSTRNNGGVIEEVDSEAIERLEDEFIRLMDLEMRKNG